MQQTIPVNDGYISSQVGTTPSTGPFAVDFPFFSLNDVTVALKPDGSDITTALIRGADYSITGVATEDGSFSSGSVTLFLAVSSTAVIRFRTTPVERLSNFPLQGFFSRLALNAELNKITVWMQELNALLGSTSEASSNHAPLVSPGFIGNPTAPTPAPGDNDTSVATTAFVQNALIALGVTFAPGMMMEYGGAVAPPTWLFCQSQLLTRASQPALFAAIGTAFNVGGETDLEFRLPDTRGRVTASPDSGGSNRLNAIIPASATIGASGGVQDHVLTTAQTPVHAHYMQNHTHGGASGFAFILANAGVSWGNSSPDPGNYMGYDFSTGGPNVGNTGNAGSGLAHPNVQPTLIIPKIIKT